MENTKSKEAVTKLGELIQGIKVAMLTTVDDDGSLRSRPMATQDAEFEGDLWFFTRASTAKVHEVEHDQHVNVSYADPGRNRYVSVSGRAQLVRDKIKVEQLWSPELKAWFPEGLEDSELALLKVTVETAEYWDSPSSTVVQIAGFVKALVTHQPYEPGDNEKIEL